MPKNAERLRWKIVFRDSIKMVQGGLGAPANVQTPMDIALCPVKETAKFVPVGHFLKGQVFDWSAGDDEAVESVGSDLFPGAVEGGKVIHRRVASNVIGDPDKAQFHLKWRRADQSCELCFGRDLVGHQVQQPNMQRANILAYRVALLHDHNTFVLENGAGWEIVVNLDRHWSLSFQTVSRPDAQAGSV